MPRPAEAIETFASFRVLSPNADHYLGNRLRPCIARTLSGRSFVRQVFAHLIRAATQALHPTGANFADASAIQNLKPMLDKQLMLDPSDFTFITLIGYRH